MFVNKTGRIVPRARRTKQVFVIWHFWGQVGFGHQGTKISSTAARTQHQETSRMNVGSSAFARVARELMFYSESGSAVP